MRFLQQYAKAHSLQVHEAEQQSEEEETEEEDTVALEKQLAWAEHRMRELESFVEHAVSLQHGLRHGHVC